MSIEKLLEQIGDELLKVHRKRLWRETHKSFAEWAEKQHGLQPSQAYDLLWHAKIRKNDLD